MNSHQLHAVGCIHSGIGLRIQIDQCRIERRTQKILFAFRQFVEYLPQQIQIGARGCVHRERAAEAGPDLSEPCAQSRLRRGGTQHRRSGDSLKNAACRMLAIVRKQFNALGQQGRNGAQQ